MKRLLILVALLISGCADGPGSSSGGELPSLPLPGEDTCSASRYAELVGQDATRLERVLLIGQVRVIRPDTAVTMDYRPERINFEIDRSGRIARITCG